MVRLKQAFPLTAPQVGEPAMNWNTGAAMQEWQLQYIRTAGGRAADPNTEIDELWVGLYNETYNSLDENSHYTIGSPPSDPVKKIWRYIANENLEVRLSYFIRLTDRDHETLEDAVSLRGARITRRGFLPPGGEQGTGSGWIANGGSIFRKGLVYWRVN
jgi:hypothetical protein